MEEQRPRRSGSGSRPPQPQRSGSRPAQSQRNGSRPTRRRRRRSSGMAAAKAALYVVAVIGVSILLAAVAWVFAQDVLALNKAPLTAVVTLTEDLFTEKTVTVEEKDKDGNTVTREETVREADMDRVAELLKEKGFIEHEFVFKVFASMTHSKTKMAPGTYTLSTDMDYRSLISALGSKSGSKVEVTVTIPEGYTLAQIFDLLAEKKVATVAELSDAAANHDYKFDFLADIPLGDAKRLEGYLFPDTYRFFIGEDPVYAINKMLVNFDSKVTSSMRDEIAENGMTLQDVVIIASLIEKETDGTDQALISSVIYNRLNNPDRETAGFLQVDAAIYYVTGREVTQADYEGLDSPYNTYLYQGLTPTAIANPGAESIWAAIHPKDTDYYYYAVGTDGLHHFSKTYNEHQRFLDSLPED